MKNKLIISCLVVLIIAIFGIFIWGLIVKKSVNDSDVDFFLKSDGELSSTYTNDAEESSQDNAGRTRIDSGDEIVDDAQNSQNDSQADSGGDQDGTSGEAGDARDEILSEEHGAASFDGVDGSGGSGGGNGDSGRPGGPGGSGEPGSSHGGAGQRGSGDEPEPPPDATPQTTPPSDKPAPPSDTTPQSTPPSDAPALGPDTTPQTTPPSDKPVPPSDMPALPTAPSPKNEHIDGDTSLCNPAIQKCVRRARIFYSRGQKVETIYYDVAK